MLFDGATLIACSSLIIHSCFPKQTLRAEQQDDQKERQSDNFTIFCANRYSTDCFGKPQEETSRKRSEDAARSRQHDNNQRFERPGKADGWRKTEGHANQRAGDARCRRTQTKRKQVCEADIDARLRRRFPILRRGANRASPTRSLQEKPKRENAKQCNPKRRQARKRQSDSRRLNPEPRITRLNRTLVAGPRQRREILENQSQPKTNQERIFDFDFGLHPCHMLKNQRIIGIPLAAFDGLSLLLRHKIYSLCSATPHMERLA